MINTERLIARLIKVRAAAAENLTARSIYQHLTVEMLECALAWSLR
jgi:hypothetical protein